MFQVARVNNNMIKAFVATNPAAGAFHAIRMPYPTGVERLQRVEGWTTRVGLIIDEICCAAGKVLVRGQFRRRSADRCESS